MTKNIYEITEDKPLSVGDPVVAFNTNVYQRTDSDKWNPNVPFVGTQEEWWEHFHEIESGNFTPLEVANKEFETWKKEYLASRLN
jgi:hypothetical protein